MNTFLWLVALFFSAPVFAKPVNINTADAKTISQSLTGISLKKAEEIVANRTQNGDFKSVADLQRVMGIGEKTIAVNKADILVSNPKAITGRYHYRIRQRHGHTHNRRTNQN